MRILPAPHGLHVGAAEIRIVAGRAERRHAVAVGDQRRVGVGVRAAVGAIGDGADEQVATRLLSGARVVQQTTRLHQSLALRIGAMRPVSSSGLVVSNGVTTVEHLKPLLRSSAIISAARGNFISLWVKTR